MENIDKSEADYALSSSKNPNSNSEPGIDNDHEENDSAEQGNDIENADQGVEDHKIENSQFSGDDDSASDDLGTKKKSKLMKPRAGGVNSNKDKKAANQNAFISGSSRPQTGRNQSGALPVGSDRA